MKQRTILFILLADGEKLKQGELSFVSFGNGGDILDYFPTGEIRFENEVNFDIVPTIYHMRKYMMYKCLQPLWRDYSPKRGIS